MLFFSSIYILLWPKLFWKIPFFHRDLYKHRHFNFLLKYYFIIWIFSLLLQNFQEGKEDLDLFANLFHFCRKFNFETENTSKSIVRPPSVRLDIFVVLFVPAKSLKRNCFIFRQNLDCGIYPNLENSMVCKLWRVDTFSYKTCFWWDFLCSLHRFSR